MIFEDSINLITSLHLKEINIKTMMTVIEKALMNLARKNFPE